MYNVDSTTFSSVLRINLVNHFKIHHHSKKSPTWLDNYSTTMVKFTTHTFYSNELNMFYTH